MPDKIISAPRVICRGGLNTNENYLFLSSYQPGSATRLVNYETAQRGGYRRINGYIEYDTVAGVIGGGTTEGPVLGVWNFHNTTTGNDELIVARKLTSGNTYRFYLLTPGVSWGLITTGITHSTVDATTGTLVKKIRAEQFNFGTVNMIMFVDGVNNAVLYDGTSWFQLNSANLGTSVSPGGNQIVNQPSLVTSFKGHLFLSGDEDTPGIIAHSAPNDPFDWTSAGGGGQLIYGYEVNQIKPFRDELYCFGKTSIKKALPDVASGFVMSDVATNVGCIARDSVVEMAGNLLFMSADGIRPIAGTERINDIEMSLLSQNIQSTIDDFIDVYDMDDLNAVIIREKQQLRYFISNSVITNAASVGLMVALRIGTDGGEPVWEFGELLGIRTSCTWSGIIENREYVFHGDYDGKIYRQEVGDDFNGTNILAIYTTPYLDFGDTEVRKLMRKINTYIAAEGSFDMALSLRFDWGSLDVTNPPNYTGLSVNAPITYDSGAAYDDGSTWGGATRTVLNTNVQGSCFSVRFSFITEGDFAPYTIFGFVVEFSQKGRQ